MKSYKKWFVGGLLLVFIWGLPRLISLDTLVKQVEASAENALGVPVKIADARVRLLPSPALVVSHVTIGEQAEARLDDVRVSPVWSTMLQSPKSLKIRIKQVQLKASVMAVYDKIDARLAQAQSSGSLPVMVSLIQIDQLDMQALYKLPLMQVQASLAAAGLDHLQVTTEAHHLQLDAVPTETGYRLALALKQFQLPDSHLTIEQGQLALALDGHTLKCVQCKLALAQGEVTLDALLDWRKQARLTGQFQMQGLSMQTLSQTGGPIYMSGVLSGRGQLHGQAKTISGLMQTSVLDARLSVNQGVLHGVDLIKVAKLLVQSGRNSGETRFDTLQTTFQQQGQRKQFKQLTMASGLMKATGQVMLSPAGQLSGDLSVAVKQSAGLLEVPLEIGGTLRAPSIYPDRAASVGAAVGTVLMPGIGTSLGMKAGSQLKSWFGGQ